MERQHALRLAAFALVSSLVTVGAILGDRALTAPAQRSSPVYDPPVLAGQQLSGGCAGGVYARKGDEIVLTSTGHCSAEGVVVHDPDGTGVRGVFGPRAVDASCPVPGHWCAASDINYLVVARDRIPWGHLNVVDMGVGSYREIAAGTKALSCADVAVGDGVEIDGREVYRAGHVTGKGDNNQDPALDGTYFPCMILSDIQVASGDSGGVVLVRGIPAGVTSRSFGGYLGFTPLAEGLAELGLTMCDMPACGLTPDG